MIQKNKANQTIIILVIITLVLLAVAYKIMAAPAVKIDPSHILPFTRNLKYKKVKINGKVLSVEYPVKEEDFEKGLGYRDSLDINSGMLFDFTGSEVKRPNFWMKGMKFSIDILWIKDNRIVGIEAGLPVPKNKNGLIEEYSPPTDIDYVLETNALWAQNNNVSVGDSLTIQ